MVGGVSASTMDMNTESSTAVPNYNWGGPEDTVLALDVETLTWTKMMTVSPFKEESLLRSQTLGDEEDIIKAPALHGHTTVPNPCNPRELLIFGGRGGQQWTNELYSLTLPAEHMPGLPYPGMPKKKLRQTFPLGGLVCLGIQKMMKRKSRKYQIQLSLGIFSVWMLRKSFLWLAMGIFLYHGRQRWRLISMQKRPRRKLRRQLR